MPGWIKTNGRQVCRYVSGSYICAFDFSCIATLLYKYGPVIREYGVFLWIWGNNIDRGEAKVNIVAEDP